MNTMMHRPNRLPEALSAPDRRLEERSEQLAQSRIEHGLALARLNDEPILTETARLIAATIHRGPTTALCRFAAGGSLKGVDLLQAHQELWDASVEETPIPWWRALDAYLTDRLARER